MRIACLWFDKPVLTSKYAELFLRFSPQICIRGERGIFVEIGKCKSLYSEPSFLARSRSLLRRNGLTARICIGNEVTDSLTLAMSGASKIEDLPLSYLIEFADPFDRDPFLRKEVLKLIASFQDLGIKSLGEFKNLPASALISRFGIVGRHCYNRVHFTDLVGWPSWRPEEILIERKDFPYFEYYGQLEPLLFELKTQLDRIFLRLFARQRRATKLQVQIKCEKVSTHPEYLRTLDFTFFTPQSSTKGTLRIFKERLTREFERNPIRSPIEGIQTKVLTTVLSSHGQKNIFNNDEEKQEMIHSVHNQLIEILGKENVYEAVLTQDRRPERSWKKKHDRPHEPESDLVDISEVIPDRPTYLCKKPVKIEITAGFVYINKRRYRILHWDNQVEKIAGGWFENAAQEISEEGIKNTYNRNYYRVEIEGHQQITVFETVNREYFLHGYFG